MDNLQEVLRMATADSPISYAANSTVQGNVIANAKPVLKQLVEELICSTMLPGGQLVVADLGCSYGPNAFAVISEVLDAVSESCRNLPRANALAPEVQFFLNDLPANDFNSIFRSLASYKKKFKEEKGEEELATRFYVAGVAGTFHGRLFPCSSVNLFHSSSSVHWLSKVPEGLKDENNNEMNKGNIYVGRTSPPCVQKAYLQQYERDFSTFLRCRSEEIRDGGFMLLTLIVRDSTDPLSGAFVLLCDLITQVLQSMAAEGIIKEGEIDALNMPFYSPSMEELHALVNDQGAFRIVGESLIESRGDGFIGPDEEGQLPSSHIRGQMAVRMAKAAMGTLFSCHFGEESIVYDMITRLENLVTRGFENGMQSNMLFGVLTLRRNNAP